MSRTLTFTLLGAFLLLPSAHTGAAALTEGIHLQVADGTLVKTEDEATVYLVDRGLLRPMVGKSYAQLYTNYSRICTVVEIPLSLVREPLASETRLVRAEDDAHVWLIDNGHSKRHVSSLAVFQRYGFSWSRVQIVQPETVDYLPIGAPLR